MEYKVNPKTLESAIGSVESALHNLEVLHNAAATCLALANDFFALANAVPGVSGGTSVSFGDALGFYNDGLLSIGRSIDSLYNSHVYGTNMVGNAINTLNTENYNFETGYASVGGEKVHLNSKYVNGDSIVAGIAIKDASGKVIDYYVFSSAVYDAEEGKYYYKGSHNGEKGGAYEAGIEDWLKRNYYNEDGTVKDGLSMSLLLGNKTNESKNSYDITPMAWVDSDALQIKDEKHDFYNVNANTEDIINDFKDKVVGISGIGAVALDTIKINEKPESTQPTPHPEPEPPKPDNVEPNDPSFGGGSPGLIGPGVSNDEGILTDSSYTRPDGKVFDLYTQNNGDCKNYATAICMSGYLDGKVSSDSAKSFSDNGKYGNLYSIEDVTKDEAIDILKNGGSVVVYGNLYRYNESDPNLGNVNLYSDGATHAVSVVQVNETGDKVYVINNNTATDRFGDKAPRGQWVDWDYLSSRPAGRAANSSYWFGNGRENCALIGIVEK